LCREEFKKKDVEFMEYRKLSLRQKDLLRKAQVFEVRKCPQSNISPRMMSTSRRQRRKESRCKLL
jgi:hypothetical protein